MKPAGHIAISTAIGLTVAVTTDTPWALATTLATGVMVDTDHTLDYYQWFIRRNTRRVFYLLHGWEYGIALVVAGFALEWHPLLVGALLGYLSHLVADQVANHAYRFSYSIIYRALHGFSMSRVSPWTIEGSTEDLRKAIKALPFGRYLAPLASLVMERGRRDPVLPNQMGSTPSSREI